MERCVPQVLTGQKEVVVQFFKLHHYPEGQKLFFIRGICRGWRFTSTRPLKGESEAGSQTEFRCSLFQFRQGFNTEEFGNVVFDAASYQESAG
jgi:hypothetical protein